MNRISDIVRNIVLSSVPATTAISEGFMNFSAYAKAIHPEVEARTKKHVQVSSIVMALSRLAKEVKEQAPLLPPINLDHLITTTGLVEYSYAKTPAVLKRIPTLLSAFSENPAAFFTVTQGISEVSLIFPAADEQTVRSHFKKITPLFTLSNLGSLTIKFGPTYMDTPNFFFALLRRMAMARINIVELVSTYTEASFILDKEDIDRAFRLLRG